MAEYAVAIVILLAQFGDVIVTAAAAVLFVVSCFVAAGRVAR